MTFGTELKAQIPAILDHIADGIQELHQFRNFIKDRSQIEKDYAQKLENLARKYSPTSRINSAETAEDLEWSTAGNTSMAAWISIVSTTMQVAKSHHQLAEDLSTNIINQLKAIAARKEEARKKHLTFYQKLKAERDKTYSEKDKAKNAYDDACANIQNIRAKMAKGSGDHDKQERQLDQALVDCNNKKNLYLLALSVANAEREKFYEGDLPALADHLQQLDTSRMLALQNIYRSYIEKESNTIASVQYHYTNALMSVDQMDPAVDDDYFVQKTLDSGIVQDMEGNIRFSFVPYSGEAGSGVGAAANTLVDNGDRLTTDEAAVIFLNNKLIKDRRQLDSIADELSAKSTELMELEKVANAIDNKASPDFDRATEKLMELVRHITLLSTQKVRIKSEVDLIIQSIGDTGLKAQSHDFKPCSFTIPTTCDYCGSTIWGLSKQGLTCKACGFNCHAKCEMKVAPNCSYVKGKINRYQPPPPSRSSLSLSSSTAGRGNLSRTRSSSTTQPIANSTPELLAAATHAPTAAATATAANSQNVEPEEPEVEQRQAIVLYSYVGQSEDEVSITEGEELTVLGHDDENGWIKVMTRNNRVGLVPASYISIQTEEEPETAYDTHEQRGNASDNTTVKYVTALYDFEAVNADELDIREGDRIMVTRQDDGGWWEGVLNGKKGVFPANYVE